MSNPLRLLARFWGFPVSWAVAWLIGGVVMLCLLAGKPFPGIFSDDTVPVRDSELWELNPR